MRAVEGPNTKIVVVGAGLAGLSAAMHLAGRGREVTVLERAPVVGGRAARLDVGGCRLDTGPTVLTMPDIVADTFASVGADMAEHLPLLRLDPAYTARFADGSRLGVHADGDQMTQAIREFAGPGEAQGYQRLREWLTRLYHVQFDRFIASNIDSPLQMLTPDLARLVAMGGFRRLDPKIGSFLRDERLKRVFTFQSLYAGMSPMRALALYGVISYMDTVAGVYFPRGGMGALPTALATAASRSGVTFRHGASVATLERNGSRVSAVITTHGERFACDALVLATEPTESYRLLGRRPRRPVPLRPAPSAFVLHATSAGGHAELGHHTISFGQAWDSTFAELITGGRVMSDPSLLITRPSATEPSPAPPGRELFSVLAPTPNLECADIDWDTHAQDYAQELIQVVAQRLIPGWQVEVLHLLSPRDWARQGMHAGTPFSYTHSFTQTGPFRPSNMPRGTDNVVLAGGGTVPGVGVPTVLISGRLAADRVTGPVRRPLTSTPRKPKGPSR